MFHFEWLPEKVANKLNKIGWLVSREFLISKREKAMNVPFLQRKRIQRREEKEASDGTNQPSPLTSIMNEVSIDAESKKEEEGV